jgi:hypothetical protein
MNFAKWTMTAFSVAAGILLSMPGTLLAEDSAIQNIQDKAKASWDKMAVDVDLSRQSYTRIAGEDVDRVSGALRELKSKNPAKVSDKEWQDMLADLDQKKTQSEDRYRVLKDSNEQDWKKAKSDLNDSLKDTKKSIENSAEKALNEKEAYELKKQIEIDQLGIKIQKLEAKIQEAQPGVKNQLTEEVNKLKSVKTEAEKHLDAIKKSPAEGDAWKSHKDMLEACLRGK